jgi:hypothetical protein
MVDKKNLLERIEKLLSIQVTASNPQALYAEILSSTITISSMLWGLSSPQVETVKTANELMNKSNWSAQAKADNMIKQCQGILKSYKDDIENGILGRLKLDYQGEVFADLLSSAKAAVDNDVREVAAVLAAAALEDSMKKIAESIGLNMDGKELSEVTNALKAAGSFSSTRASLVSGMLAFRNKAMHAQWDKLDMIETKTVISFVETLLSEYFRS